MKVLTDLEICKRIAEIEGKPHEVDCDKLYVTGEVFGTSYRELFSPLTGDALCFKLMVKYNVSFWQLNKMFCAKVRNPDFRVDSAKSPNRAICLAIIKSKEQG
jgi:hypothetical protein